VMAAPWHTLPDPPIAAGTGLTVTWAVRLHVVDSCVKVTVAVPVLTPFTTALLPVVAPSVAVPLMAHVPGDDVLPSVVVLPAHTLRLPLIAAGTLLTVTCAVRLHVVDVCVKVTTAVPPDMPLIVALLAVVAPRVAAAPLRAHVPGADASFTVAACPAHTFSAPVIADGRLLTVTTRVVTQPTPPTEYVIVVVPLSSGLTAPMVLTVATEVLLLVHTPPPVASLRLSGVPMHASGEPLIGAGALLTVMVFTATQPEDVIV